MLRRTLIPLALLLAGCAHTAVSVNTGALAGPAPSPGATVVSGGAGLQVSASGRAAAVVVLGGIVAGVAARANDPQPAYDYGRPFEGFWGRRAPAMDPTRRVSEQDCTKPIEGSGNLRCR